MLNTNDSNVHTPNTQQSPYIVTDWKLTNVMIVHLYMASDIRHRISYILWRQCDVHKAWWGVLITSYMHAHNICTSSTLLPYTVHTMWIVCGSPGMVYSMCTSRNNNKHLNFTLLSEHEPFPVSTPLVEYLAYKHSSCTWDDADAQMRSENNLPWTSVHAPPSTLCLGRQQHVANDIFETSPSSNLAKLFACHLLCCPIPTFATII